LTNVGDQWSQHDLFAACGDTEKVSHSSRSAMGKKREDLVTEKRGENERARRQERI